MARILEDMTRLRDEILKGYAARNQMMQGLHRFANTLHSEVSDMMGRFAGSRERTAKKMTEERRVFVSDLQQKVTKVKNDFARELEETRRIWSGGRGASTFTRQSALTEHFTKKKGAREKK